jgi:DNA-binding CsgD family transcriptional regulator
VAKLNPELAREIRARAAAGERQLDIAKAFGVTPPTVCQVLKGNLYPDQPRPRPPRPRQRTPARPRPLTPNATRVLAILKGRSSALSRQEVAETLGVSPEVAGNALRILWKRRLAERLGSGHETSYRVPQAPIIQVAPRGDRPRLLGLRAAWLREQQSQAGGDQIAEAAQ